MYHSIYENREDLREYQPNSLLLFALILKFGLEDIQEIASDVITDGRDDKKIDLVYIDKEKRIAVIAQGYEAENRNRESAPANKASDLNTGLAWLLERNIDDLPIDIKSAALNLRSAIDEDEIDSLEVWYVHNLNEHSNVEQELKTVEVTAKRILNGSEVKVSAHEIGNNTLNSWYRGIETPILVSDEIEFSTTNGFPSKGESWEAYTTYIKANELYEIYSRYEKDLFSANVRDYLGSRRSSSNINNAIKLSVSETPDLFFVYNNGITAITSDFSVTENTVKLTGMSIVNGAQTTGSIGTMQDTPDENCIVPLRIIRCNDKNTIQNIVLYNNSQNKISPADFRSNDQIQTRLRSEFEGLTEFSYNGGRRGSADDAIRRPSNMIPSATASQALAAFHGSPAVSYNKKSDIWKNDRLYSQFFNEKTTAKHLVFAYTMFVAITKKKVELKSKSEEEILEDEKNQLDFLRRRGAIYMLMSSISSCMEIILGTAVPNKFRLNFKNQIGNDEALTKWNLIIDSTVTFHEKITKPTETSLKNSDDLQTSMSDFKSMVNSTKRFNQQIFDEFKEAVEW